MHSCDTHITLHIHHHHPQEFRAKPARSPQRRRKASPSNPFQRTRFNATMTGKVVHINSDEEFRQHFKATTSFGAPTAIFIDYFAEW